MAKKKATITASDFEKIGDLYRQMEDIDEKIVSEIKRLKNKILNRFDNVIGVISKAINKKATKTNFLDDDLEYICRGIALGDNEGCGVWVGESFLKTPLCEIPYPLFISGTDSEISGWAKGVVKEKIDSEDQRKKLLAKLSPAEKELLGVRE